MENVFVCVNLYYCGGCETEIDREEEIYRHRKTKGRHREKTNISLIQVLEIQYKSKTGIGNERLWWNTFNKKLLKEINGN